MATWVKSLPHSMSGAGTGPAPLVRTLAPVLDQLVKIGVADLLLAGITLEGREGRCLGPLRGGFPATHISAI